MMPRNDGGFRGGLVRESGGVVRRRQEAVVFGIPLDRIDPVQDTGEIGRPLAQDAVKAKTKFRGLNLRRVAGADGCNRLGIQHAALEKADAAPEFQPVDRQLFPPEVETREPIRGAHALIRKIVNREHRRCAAQNRMRGIQRLQVHGRQACLPVVRVNDRGSLALPRHEFEGGAHEKGKAPGVVGYSAPPTP